MIWRVQYKDRSFSVFGMHPLNLQKDRGATIVCFNTSENFKFLVDNWQEFVEEKIIMIFINPKSKIDDKWTVSCHTHNLVCDKSNLKQGLKSMSEAVDLLTEPQITSIIAEEI